jgi:hypothetical protein
MDATGGPGTIGRKRAGGKKAAPRPQAWQVDDDVIAGPPNVDVFSVNGEAQIGEDFEGQGHSVRIHP